MTSFVCGSYISSCMIDIPLYWLLCVDFSLFLAFVTRPSIMTDYYFLLLMYTQTAMMKNVYW